MFVYAHLYLVHVEDPAFERALVELAEVDPVAAMAVMALAELDRDGGEVASAPSVIARLDEPAAMHAASDVVSVDLSLRAGTVQDDLSLTVTLSDGAWVDAPVTWTGVLPSSQRLLTRSVAPGWLLAVETSLAPDAETAGLWMREQDDRVQAVLDAYPTGSARARSRAIADLLASTGSEP